MSKRTKTIESDYPGRHVIVEKSTTMSHLSVVDTDTDIGTRVALSEKNRRDIAEALFPLHEDPSRRINLRLERELTNVERERDEWQERAQVAEALVAEQRPAIDPNPFIYGVRESAVSLHRVMLDGRVAHIDEGGATVVVTVPGTVAEVREKAAKHLVAVARCEAVARAMESRPAFLKDQT